MMERHIDADGDRWFVKLGEYPPHPGVGVVLFFPRNDQRAYRVIEVPQNRFASQEALEKLSDKDLLALFRGGDAMDYSHEEGAGALHPTHIAQQLPPDVGTNET